MRRSRVLFTAAVLWWILSGQRDSVTYPHCDARILHGPGECEVCDLHPEWQDLRKQWGVAFSGQVPTVGQHPCPADSAQPFFTYERWAGNRKQTIWQRKLEEARNDLIHLTEL